MPIRLVFLLVVASMLQVLSGCAGGRHARTGAALGGLTGGAIGAAAGSHSGKSLEGAAIGALAGSVLGGAVGDATDREIEEIEQSHDAWQQRERAQAVTLEQVIQMTQSRLGDTVVANQIRAQGVIGPLSTDDLVFLKQNGVSDSVISAWQQAPVAGVAPAEYIRTAPVRPVIVREHWVEPVYGPGCWHHSPWRHYHGHRAALHLDF